MREGRLQPPVVFFLGCTCLIHLEISSTCIDLCFFPKLYVLYPFGDFKHLQRPAQTYKPCARTNAQKDAYVHTLTHTHTYLQGGGCHPPGTGCALPKPTNLAHTHTHIHTHSYREENATLQASDVPCPNLQTSYTHTHTHTCTHTQGGGCHLPGIRCGHPQAGGTT